MKKKSLIIEQNSNSNNKINNNVSQLNFNNSKQKFKFNLNPYNRFDLKEQLGEGSFSRIYKSFDHQLNKQVALKMEKEDKNKKILKYEFEILMRLQGLENSPRVYDFINMENKLNKVINLNNDENRNNKFLTPNSNFIVMQLLGPNVAHYKKINQNFNISSAYEILVQMLNSIEQIHKKGIIHRDIKPSNFVIESNENDLIKVYIVDFGLARIHLDKLKNVIPMRSDTDFRGTLTYASLNAHNKLDLSRRDDLWSFFFVILDLLNVNIPWKNIKDDKDEIANCKLNFLNTFEQFLFVNSFENFIVKNLVLILNHLKSLNYEDRPDYDFIKNKLRNILNKNVESFNLDDKSSLCKNINTHTPINEYINYIMENYKKIEIKPTINRNDNFNNNQFLFVQNFINNYIPNLLNTSNMNESKNMLPLLKYNHINNEFEKSYNNNNINNTCKNFDILKLNRKRNREDYKNLNLNNIYKNEENKRSNNSNNKGTENVNHIYEKVNTILSNLKSKKNSKIENNHHHKVTTCADKNLIKFIMNNINKINGVFTPTNKNNKNINNNNLSNLGIYIDLINEEEDIPVFDLRDNY